MARLERFISVDVEIDGPIPGDFSMLSLGASVVGRPEQNLYLEFKPISDRYDLETLLVSGLDRQRLVQEALDPWVAMSFLKKWVESISLEEDVEVIFVGNNAPFDWMFCHWYFIHFLGSNPFGHSALDIPSYAMGKLNTTRKQASLKRLPLGLRLEEDLSHNALSDARAQGQAFHRLLQHPI